MLIVLQCSLLLATQPFLPSSCFTFSISSSMVLDASYGKQRDFISKRSTFIVLKSTIRIFFFCLLLISPSIYSLPRFSGPFLWKSYQSEFLAPCPYLLIFVLSPEADGKKGKPKRFQFYNPVLVMTDKTELKYL